MLQFPGTSLTFCSFLHLPGGSQVPSAPGFSLQNTSSQVQLWEST